MGVSIQYLMLCHWVRAQVENYESDLCLSGSVSFTRRRCWHSRHGSHHLHHTWQICYNFDHQQDRCGPPTLHCWLYHEHKLHWLRALSLWLRPLSGTVYRPTSGRATRCWLSDVIWKLTILPPRMRNVAIPVPLCLWSSQRSTNSIIIIITMTWKVFLHTLDILQNSYATNCI